VRFGSRMRRSQSGLGPRLGHIRFAGRQFLVCMGDALDTASSDLDVQELRSLSRQLGASPALRRLASLARILELEDLAQQLLEGVRVPKTPIPADPRQPGPREWEDAAAGVVWSTPALDTVRTRTTGEA
jgi:hypothetical protein